eukprot:1323159-Amorphochlora_amoeboformis.AAC.1
MSAMGFVTVQRARCRMTPRARILGFLAVAAFAVGRSSRVDPRTVVTGISGKAVCDIARSHSVQVVLSVTYRGITYPLLQCHISHVAPFDALRSTGEAEMEKHGELEACLTQLRKPSDEDKLVGLLIVSKHLNVGCRGAPLRLSLF